MAIGLWPEQLRFVYYILSAVFNGLALHLLISTPDVLYVISTAILIKSSFIRWSFILPLLHFNPCSLYFPEVWLLATLCLQNY